MVSRKMKLVSAAVAVALLAMLAPRFITIPSVQNMRSQQHGILTCGMTTPATDCEKLNMMLPVR
jgi:hypothetical protein